MKVNLTSSVRQIGSDPFDEFLSETRIVRSYTVSLEGPVFGRFDPWIKLDFGIAAMGYVCMY